MPFLWRVRLAAECIQYSVQVESDCAPLHTIHNYHILHIELDRNLRGSLMQYAILTCALSTGAY